jgi:hypothetical protein
VNESAAADQSIIRRAVPKAHASGHRCAVIVVQKVVANILDSTAPRG